MHESQTWRGRLGELLADPHIRQHLAKGIDISLITLQRWASGKSTPRPDNLRQLLNALPEERQRLIPLIRSEFPGFLDTSSSFQENEENTTISSSFYAQVLDKYTATPAGSRENTLGALILQHLIQQLDAQHQGIVVALARCLKPATPGPIRSLFITTIKGTAPWDIHLEQETQFFGAESQAGHALISRHPIIIQKSQDKDRLFPRHRLPQEESSATFPILMADRAAGSLCFASTQANYFRQSYIDLIQNYVDLLVLAFETHTFYDLSNIQLGIMPARTEQQPYLDSHQQRVSRLCETAQSDQTMPQSTAEHLAWLEIEEALLRYKH